MQQIISTSVNNNTVLSTLFTLIVGLHFTVYLLPTSTYYWIMHGILNRSGIPQLTKNQCIKGRQNDLVMVPLFWQGEALLLKIARRLAQEMLKQLPAHRHEEVQKAAAAAFTLTQSSIFRTCCAIRCCKEDEPTILIWV